MKGARVKVQTVRTKRVALRFLDIEPGDSVTLCTAQGQHRTGRAVMWGPHGVVLNMGGAHGTPAVCTATNFVGATRGAK